ncbi:isopentenyl-diphosphate Delta-isomerase [Sulfitobacter sp. D35]|uniref:isopentenyl-diphosphate Delta-isomerase n=1 Tax=Sulfitobacter sp. D35 TaxID=3083252 RepID=UPI00296E74B9|nr:isopentenyl-diphosphate Delta-isomerase [Sulfitobacter sp. D35]MDW4499248.1 isopentenyl-diphosphate Delta-isomerase [Sulfitobacter sp. D35]
MEILIPAWVDGALTPVEKLDAHLRGLRHKAVSVFVLRGDAVLMQRRAMGKYHTPGLWTNTCCTHPGWDETAADCATRRLREELGVTGLELRHAHQLEYRAEVGGGMVEHELVDVFLAEAGDTLAVTPNPDEVMDTAWMAMDDLRAAVAARPEEFTPWLRIYLDDHAERIFGRA